MGRRTAGFTVINAVITFFYRHFGVMSIGINKDALIMGGTAIYSR